MSQISDDRQEFGRWTSEAVRSLGSDLPLWQQCVETMVALDKHHYPYLWTWMGLPIIQFPADIVATQEVVFATKPDIVIETGVARGGSIVFIASLLKLLGNNGRVIGVDIDIRPHNRKQIENSSVSDAIFLIEGSSTDSATIAAVQQEIPDSARVMVILDSDHSRDHVLAECRAYGAMVTQGCHLIVADTALGLLREEQTPRNRSQVWLKGNEPLAAVEQYLAEMDCFAQDKTINDKLVISSSPGGFLRRMF